MLPPPSSGTLLSGRYRLEDRIGTGGAGAVWRATDTVLTRPVAVKLLHDQQALAGEALRARFRREAMAAAAIHHAHAAVVFDIGEDDGRDYLVMELVDGPSLADVMDGRPIDAGVVAAIGVQVAGALGAAHERGLAHRDVKPANVLLSPEGAAKVVDFGIAKALDETTQPTAGTVMGTAAYLAPEQVEPGADVDGRADVYALGLVLHELLTGRPPFPGTTTAELTAQRLVGDVPPPSRWLPSLPATVDTVVATATRRDPDRRYADGAELARALAPAVPDRALQLVAELAHRQPPARERTRPLTVAVPTVAPTETIPVTDGPSSSGGSPPAEAEPPPPRARPRMGVWAGFVVVALAALAATVMTSGDPPDGAGGGDASPAPSYRIRSATDVDPHGDDGREHPEDVAAAYDGDPATTWPTQRYRTASFGGLKPGVGIAFDLGRSVAVSQVRLRLATPGVDLEIHTADEAFADGGLGDPVGGVDGAPAEVTVDVEGASGRYWLVWITSVPDGRAEIAEVVFDR